MIKKACPFCGKFDGYITGHGGENIETTHSFNCHCFYGKHETAKEAEEAWCVRHDVAGNALVDSEWKAIAEDAILKLMSLQDYFERDTGVSDMRDKYKLLVKGEQ